MMDLSSPPPSLFRRGLSPLSRMLICVVFSLTLLLGDSYYGVLGRARDSVEMVLYPIQWLINSQITLTRSINSYLTLQSVLAQQNHRLEYNALILSAKSQRLDTLEQENAQLRNLLTLRTQQPERSEPAEVLYTSRDPFSYKLTIDKGERDGVANGSPVIDNQGLIGQITRVAPLSSDVTLIVERNHSVPVMVQRNGLRALVYGTGGGLEVRFMSNHADIQANDILVTSGIDSLYPAGLKVARVTQVERNPSTAFARISCAPIGQVMQNRFALVLHNQFTLPSQQPVAATSPAKLHP